MNITVYLGSSFPTEGNLIERCRELGNYIGSNGHTLVYGGSYAGLMGVLAESVLDAGGEAIGVEPQFFIDMGYEYNRLTELIITKDMSERKAKMIELGNAFIAFPGGTGTLEEVSEVMSKLSLKHLDCPCIIYNIDGFYDGLKTLVDTMRDSSFTDYDKLSNVHFLESIEEIDEIIRNI